MTQAKRNSLIGLFIPMLVIGQLLSQTARALENPWAQAHSPSVGSAEAIGAYSAGCLRGAVELPEDGPGFQVVRLSRHRRFGHPAMIEYLRWLGAESQKAGEPAVIIGDVGMARGGPTLSAHNSHQTGLDVDVWYNRIGHKMSRREREKAGAKNMVVRATRKVNPRAFGAAELALLKRAATYPGIDRVLVSYAIKKDLCERLPNEDWIRKIRPWFGHVDHFHARLVCPTGSPECKSVADPIPAGNGCDDTLAWWFSDEAREAENKKSTEPPKMPDLPAACATVLASASVQPERTVVAKGVKASKINGRGRPRSKAGASKS